MPPSYQPRQEYQNRLEHRHAEKSRFLKRDLALGYCRIGAFVLLLWCAWAVIYSRQLGAGWLIAALVVFIGLMAVHARAMARQLQAERGIRFYEAALERLNDQWAGKGVTGERFLDAQHPYAIDLDLFGKGSMFERLCLARTASGEETLARWMLIPAKVDVIKARQEAVEELRGELELRESLALLGEDARAAADTQSLLEWANAPASFTALPVRLLTALIGIETVVAFWWLWFGLNPLWFIGGIVLGAGLKLVFRKPLQSTRGHLEAFSNELTLVAQMMKLIEDREHRAARLQQLRQTLRETDTPASERAGKLESLVGMLNSRANPLFAPTAAMLLWDLQCAFAIENWRVQNGKSLQNWLEIIGEFEALNSLAAYAYENPAYTFAQMVEGSPRFEAQNLAHPLIPASQAIPNSIEINEKARLYIVSGSNMAGKSTLLRSIGLNAILGLMGAPVCAERLTLTFLNLGASIRTQDSIQAGISRFYAEILRLRQIVQISREQPPLLFLFDEILHGTNSHDRRLGAQGLARALMDTSAIGLLTTHDLALARIAEEEKMPVVNVHFEDQIEDGKMRFDYRLRPGVVEKSNALELMRAVGLDV